MDICAVLTPKDIEKLRAALGDLRPLHRMTPQPLSFLQTPKPGEPVNNLYLQTDWGMVDILSVVLGLGDFKVDAGTVGSPKGLQPVSESKI